MRWLWSWGRRGMEARRGVRAGGGSGSETRVRGVARRSELPVQTGAAQVPCRQQRPGKDAPSVRDGAGSVRYDFTSGRRPRRLRCETTLPGLQRIPSAATTSSAPSPLVGTRAAARPVPWL